MPALYVSPGTARVSGAYACVRFLGVGTAWKTSAPTFTPSGLVGVVIGSVTVVSDTEAQAPVTYPGTAGTVTWTDSTTSATATQAVAKLPAGKRFVGRR